MTIRCATLCTPIFFTLYTELRANTHVITVVIITTAYGSHTLTQRHKASTKSVDKDKETKVYAKITSVML